MCGRFANNQKLDQQAARFDAAAPGDDWQPSANCAPSQLLPIILSHGNKTWLRLAEWGFQCSWGKPLINTQSETAAEKNTFKESFANQRCIVPAAAFYEWQKIDGVKIPQIITCTDQNIFSIPGIWHNATVNNEKRG